jgi:hypothetical protein
MTQSSSEAALFEQFAACTGRAWHLEMRDTYEGHSGASTARLDAWRAAGDSFDWRSENHLREFWFNIIRGMVGRGADMRRARVVSLPPTDYIRWEFDITPGNLAAGEKVRWVDRARASDLLLPGNDLWVFDDQVFFNLCAGDGEHLRWEASDDPQVLERAVSAFQQVWARAEDHEDFKLT